MYNQFFNIKLMSLRFVIYSFLIYYKKKKIIQRSCVKNNIKYIATIESISLRVKSVKFRL